MQLLLVRHALPHRSDHGRGADPELSEIGVEQAARFRSQLDRRLSDRYHGPVAWDVAPTESEATA